MGGSLSTIRWTPYGPMPGNDHKHKTKRLQHHHNPLRKSNSFPPPSTSPSNSTSNLSYSDQEYDSDHHHGGGDGESHQNDHLGTSGILMGVNAPPLYDACLVGRWEDVLEICGVEESTENSDVSPQTASTATACTSSEDGTAENPGWPADDADDANNDDNEGVRSRVTPIATGRGGDGDNNNNNNNEEGNNIGLQTRYADRRRNTPLHLACRRQPPPSVVRALLDRSPCEAVSRRTADGLTPLHFAAYCGAGVEVVSMLVDRMRSDAAVGRAMRLSSALTVDENEADTTFLGNHSNRSGEGGSGGSSRWRLPSEEEGTNAGEHVELPPTRLLDRRRRTPLHCALSGFRTPIRPLVVRKLLAVDPASAALGDERGRTPLSLLFDDYAEEIMEALEEDVTPEIVQERIKKGGELHECWKMLNVLLQAAYVGSVCEDEVGEEGERTTPPLAPVTVALAAQTIGEESGETSELPPLPQDRHAPQASEVKNVFEMYDQEHFSMLHAAAGVWECPAPLAKLALKCLCGGARKSAGDGGAASPAEDWENHSPTTADNLSYADALASGPAAPEAADGGEEEDPIRRPDEETMRLPLHIAVCARPRAREGHSARLKVWLSSPEACPTRSLNLGNNARDSFTTAASASMSLATHPGKNRGRSTSVDTNGRGGQKVYNPRFGRSPSRDSVVALSSSQRRGSSTGGSNNTSYLARSASNSSISANIAREPFLQHTMVRDILNLYPAAASVVDDRTGKLPIVLAIEHGKSWETAVGPLLDAYPTPFGGGGDGGMALPDDSHEGRSHREALQAALFLALSSPELHVREEALRTAGKLAQWGGVYGMPASLDGIVSEWLDTVSNHSVGNNTVEAPASPEGIVVGPGATSSPYELIQTQSSHLTAVGEVVSHSRPASISDGVARVCLDTSREYLFSKDGSVREAASRVLGNTLDSLGDADDAANVMREVVLNLTNDDGSACSTSSSTVSKSGRNTDDDVIVKHGKLLACNSILLTQWGGELMATPDISEAIMTSLHACIKDKNTVVRSAAYLAVGPILGKSPAPDDQKVACTTATLTLKELRSDILKGTRASEQVDVQLALARGLTSASRMHPNLFLCKSGMPIMDAALMLAMSSSSARPNVQKAFQIFLWVALQMGCCARGGNDGDSMEQEAAKVVDDGDSKSVSGAAGGSMSPGLEKYIELAEGENGRIMMKFVTQTLAKIEDLDDQGGLC